MGVIDIVMMGLCFNATCPGDDMFLKDTSATRKETLHLLGNDLNGKHLKVATAQNEPISYAVLENDTWIGKGVAFQFMDIIGEKYNFTYEVVLPKEDNLDVESEGIFGLLARSEADLAAAFLPVIPALWNHIRYSRSIDRGEWVVLMNRPQESATGSGLWAPFTLRVWILILASLLCVGPVIYGLIRLQARLCRDDESKIYPLHSCVWFVYGALLKQGSTLSPTTDSSRLLFSTWWIFITILTAFYTANLTAFLTLSRFTLPISTVNDIGTKKYAWVTHKGSTIEAQVKQDDVLRSGLEGSRREYTTDNGSSILQEWVQKKGYMYIGEKPIVEYMMYDDYMHRSDPNNSESDRCVFVITKWPVLSIDRAFAYSKDFKYYTLFDNLIGSLVESGIVKFKLREDLPDTEICPLDLKSSERQLRNADLFMTYVIVGAGFIVAAIVFAVEMTTHYLRNKEMEQSVATPKDIHGLHNPMGGGGGSMERARTKKEKLLFARSNKNTRVKFLKDMEDMFPPPPPYHALFNPPFANSPAGKKMTINGREYWVVSSVYGETRYIPVRTPSALLFQYTD